MSDPNDGRIITSFSVPYSIVIQSWGEGDYSWSGLNGSEFRSGFSDVDAAIDDAYNWGKNA